MSRKLSLPLDEYKVQTNKLNGELIDPDLGIKLPWLQRFAGSSIKTLILSFGPCPLIGTYTV